MQLNFRSTPPPRPRPDELDKLVCLIGEVKVILTRLAKDTTQENSNQHEVCNG